VAEGIVGIDRIIKILNVYRDELVCEDKGIYSIEKFIQSRRLMYWQVYLHKAALSAEYIAVNILRRVRALLEDDQEVFLDDTLGFFFRNRLSPDKLDENVMSRYLQLDDTDIEYHIKKWQFHPDPVLADLCQRFLSRKLLKVKLQNTPFEDSEVEALREKFTRKSDFSLADASYFVFSGQVSNQAYFENSKQPIMIWFKNGEIKDLASASDMGNVHALSEPVVKYYLCYPESLREE
jgi:uncharacterized protein